MATLPVQSTFQITEKANNMALDINPGSSILEWPNEAGFQTLHEERTPISLTVQGSIPAYAAGALYRTGPSSYRVSRSSKSDFVCSHWFDGFGHTHRFEIVAEEDGSTKVLYNSRRANDSLIANVSKTGKYGGITFGQRRDPCVGIFGKVMSVFTAVPKKDPKDPSMVNVGVTIRPERPGLPSSRKNGSTKVGHSTGPRNLWAASDNSQFKELDPQTLEPIGISSQKALHPSLKGPFSAAHAQSDPLTGDVFNYNLDLGVHATYRIFKTSAATQETEILATIEGKGVKAAYIHSFFLTQDYIILCIWSAWYSRNGIQILIEQNLLDAISAFDPSHQTHWYVIDRRNGNGLVAEFQSPAAFCFHTVNAWQEVNVNGETDIFCELVEFENLDVLHKFYYENMTSAGKNTVAFNGEKGGSSIPRLARYRLSNIPTKDLKRASNLTSSKIREAELVLTIPKMKIGELPTINPLFAMKENRYIYGIVNRGYSSFLDGISKVDTKSGKVVFWDQKGHTPGEAIFVPNPEGKEEDDGVLLSVVLDGVREGSYLLCLDARTMEEVGRAEVGFAVGFGFHGVHVKG